MMGDNSVSVGSSQSLRDTLKKYAPQRTADTTLDKWVMYLSVSHDVDTVDDLLQEMGSKTRRTYRSNPAALLTSKLSRAIKAILVPSAIPAAVRST
jgi:hypothetical protein